MTHDEHSSLRRLEELFHRAVDLPPDEREALLEPLREADPTLAADLERLLGRADHGNDLSAVGALTAALADGSAAGRRLGAYRLLEQVGQGGMGEVFRAQRADGQYDQTVAVKRIRTGFATRDLDERFRTERQILARLEHPSIARLLDGSVAEDGSPYLVMEYVEGRPITDYCDAERLDVHDRLRLFQSVCRAVQYAHRNLVVHRDLKPSNILVNAAGEAKLLDFGIAKLLGTDDQPSADLTRTLAPALTPGYASPEQVRGEAITTATDVYVLGLLLYELLCGCRAQHPADGSLAALERVVCDEDPKPPSQALAAGDAAGVASRLEARGGERLIALRRGLAGDLDTIVATAIQKDPARRYGSVERLDEDIERYLTGQPVLARPDSALYRVGKFVRRHRFSVAATAAVAVALVTGLTMALVGLERARRAAATSDQVTEFLISVYDTADPEMRAAGARQTSAHEIVEAGQARIAGLRIDDPVVTSKLELAVGRIARKVGEYETAKSLLGPVALEAPDAEVQRRALFELGAAQARSGEEDSALATLSEAQRQCQAAGEELCVVEALVARSEIEVERLEIDAARASLNEALERAEALPVSRRSRGLIAWATYGLGVAEHRTGDPKRGYELMARAERLYGQLEDQPTVEAGQSYLVAGVSTSARGEHERAAELLEKARQVFVDLFGPRHIRVAYVDFVLSGTLSDLGRLDEARSAAESSLETRRRILGDGHKDTGMAWGALAAVLADLGDVEAAILAAETSRSIIRTASRMSYANVGRLLSGLQVRAGEPAAALATARESLAVYEELMGDDNAMSLRAHVSIAIAQAAAGDLAAAIDSQRRAIAIGDAKLRPDHPRRPALLVGLGELELRAGRRSDAVRTLETAATLAETADPAQLEQATRARQLLAGLS